MGDPPHLTLLPDERVLWQGQPRQGVILRAQDAFTIPFSLLWCGFAVFWEATVIASGAPFFFKLFGVPFVLVGLYMVIGRFFIDAYQRKRTWYTLTDQRALITGSTRTTTERAIDLFGTPHISVDSRKDGTGTISFGGGPSLPFANLTRRRRRDQPPAFEAIADAASVYRLIMEAKHAGRK